MLIPGPSDQPSPISLSLNGVHVFIGIPCGPEIPCQTVKSLLATAHRLQRANVPYDLTLVSGCSIVESARNLVVKAFLASKSTHLFMIDSDMEWFDDDFMRALAITTRLPIVTGAYVAKRDPPVFMLGRNAKQKIEGDGFGCLPITRTGLGFCCVQRRVIEALAQESPKITAFGSQEPFPAIFQCDIVGSEFRGEDTRFFEDAARLGYQCWLNPNIKLGHVGQKVYSATISDYLHEVG